MEETHVRLLCPDCGKTWSSSPSKLPEPARTFNCPGCHASRRLAEFARTEHDLRAMEGL